MTNSFQRATEAMMFLTLRRTKAKRTIARTVFLSLALTAPMAAFSACDHTNPDDFQVPQPLMEAGGSVLGDAADVDVLDAGDASQADGADAADGGHDAADANVTDADADVTDAAVDG